MLIGESLVRNKLILRNQALLGAGAFVAETPGIIEGNTLVAPFPPAGRCVTLAAAETQTPEDV